MSGTKQVLEDSQTEKDPYLIDFLGDKYVVYPNVFSPKYFTDTEFFAKNLPIYAGEDVLEIGCGTGLVSIAAKRKGAHKVLAVDINEHAVQNTLDNVQRHNLQNKIEVRWSDVYSTVRVDEKFDVIFWNTPFGLVERENLSDLEKAVFDYGYKATEKFIQEAHQHLKPDGRVLIGFSSTLGKLELLERFVKEAGMKMRILCQIESVEVHPVKFEIFEAK